MITVLTVDDARTAAAAVLDPEVPVLTIADLGVLRDVEVRDDGTAVVTITPTYSGCPAMDVIRRDVEDAVRSAGFAAVEVRTVLSPALVGHPVGSGPRRASRCGCARSAASRSTTSRRSDGC